MKYFRIAYGTLMIVLPTLLWILLLFKANPRIEWNGGQVAIMVVVTIAGWFGGAMILLLNRHNRTIDNEINQN